MTKSIDKTSASKTAPKKTKPAAPLPPLPEAIANPAVAPEPIALPTRKQLALRSLDSPPAIVMPRVPNGFTALTVEEVRRLKKPTAEQRGEAVASAEELRTSKVYRDDFGKRAPDPVDLATRLEVAAEWDAFFEDVTKVAVYAGAMREIAWDGVLGPAAKLQKQFVPAVQDEADVAKRYPSLAKFFGARSAAAERAVQTKKLLKEAKKNNGAGGAKA